MFILAGIHILLLIAQLVERGTVMFESQKSLGRWFESGSRDIFFITKRNLFLRIPPVIFFKLQINFFKKPFNFSQCYLPVSILIGYFEKLPHPNLALQRQRHVIKN